MKIVILLANYGSGHESVARNLTNILHEHDIEVYNAKRIDNKYMAKSSEYLYNNIITKNASHKPIKRLFSLGFNVSAHSKVLSHVFIQRSGYKFIEELVETEEPDLIITTFPYYMKTEKVPILTIITDYGFSQSWYEKNIDYYFVCTNKIKQKLMELKVPEECIFLTGIPLSKEFDRTNESKCVQKIFFNLGARGTYKYKYLVNSIDYSLEKGLDVTVLCGKNAKLYEKLAIIYEDKIKLYKYTNKICDLIAENDLVITKAGGLSVTECVMGETPMIIDLDQSLDGQEKFNYEYVEEHEVGLLTSERKMNKAIEKFITEPEFYKKAVKNIQDIKIYNQTEGILNIIEYILKKENNVKDKQSN